MQINWQRNDQKDNGIFSTVTLDWNAWTGVGLENNQYEIPAGTYSLQWHISPHLNNARVPLLQNVPRRTEVLIHWGNSESCSLGCLLCGLKIDGSDIDSTQTACRQLFSLIDAVGIENVTITIK